MAYVNVAEWKTDQVCEWLKGLENSVLPYVHSFTNHGVSGQQLLSLRPDDLERLGVLKLGHQEIILEAVEHLRNFHYELDRENLQLLALRLSCQARSLCNELVGRADTRVATQTLADVASVVTAVKPLIRWLDRPPFSGQLEYNEKKARLMKLSLEMATCAQRDRFAEKPIEEIRSTCEELAQLADYIVQDIADPMILQPASLDLATLKKKPTGDDLGFYVLPSFHGAHQIAEIKFGSAAHQCGKMEEGDEIVQVNYQTVVGWERKNVLELFRESPSEILLTLKRRPRHTKVYGQIYIKPYRLPSNKKTPYTTRWQHNLPSPRPELLTIPDFTMPLPRHTPAIAAVKPSPSPEPMLDAMAACTDDESSASDSEVEPPELLSIPPHTAKPTRTVRIRRRATITGASPTTKHGIDIERFWQEFKQERNTTFQLRDKAASCAHGLDGVSSGNGNNNAGPGPTGNLRPQTCLGIEQRQTTKRRKKPDEEDGKLIIDEKRGNEKSEVIEKSSDVVESSTVTASEVKSDNKEEPNSIKDSELEKNGEVSAEVNVVPKPANNEEEKIAIEDSVDSETLEKSITSNVARKIIDIEKHIAKNNEGFANPRIKRSESNVTISKNSNTESQSDRLSLDSQNASDNVDSGIENATSTSSDPSGRTETSPSKSSNRESSEEKSESTGSCVGNSRESVSSEDQTSLKNFGKILRSIDRALTEHEKLLEKSVNVEQTSVEVKLDVEPRKEVIEKPTPPEPPPRRYFTKPTAPDRPSLRKEPKKVETESVTYSNFVDESPMDSSLEEPNATINEQKPILPADNFTYMEHRGRYQPAGREERTLEKYEPFVEKFGQRTDNQHYHHYYQYDNAPPPPPRPPALRSTDIPDGSCYSKQQSSPEPGRVRGTPQPEKDRGSVVNKAMMVARSIGLHGSAAKSTTGTSPRGGRKQNALLKKRNVSVKEVGTGELEGWLTYRSRGAGGAWARAWFVLKKSSLYRFKGLDSQKADCLIALTGFTVSQAQEVKSRKYAFKIYHTGTVFYFAADTEDCLLTWLDAVGKATLAQRDSNNQNQRHSGLFSETDDDEEEHHHENEAEYPAKSRLSCTALPTDGKTNDKGFGSLRKIAPKESTSKDHRDVSGASLDRKYLRFLGAASRNQNVPVPTAQFRSYRRVLPTTTPITKSKDSAGHFADPQITIAGSTFYGSAVSQSTEMSSSGGSHDMADYRRAADNRYFGGQSRRPTSSDLQEFVTLEEFMLSQQQQRQYRQQRVDEEEQRSNMSNSHRSESPASISSTPSISVVDHSQYRNYEDNTLPAYDVYSRESSSTSQRTNGRRLTVNQQNGCCSPYYATQQQQPCCQQEWRRRDSIRDMEVPQRRLFRNGTAGSSDDLTAYLQPRGTDTLQRLKKESAITRKGSFNLRRRENVATSDEHHQQRCWLDSLKRSGSDKKSEKNKLKNAAQYQPPPIPASQLQFDKPDKMRAAFEMHLDKVPSNERTPQKPNRLKSLFGSKCHQKPCTLDLPKDAPTQKTLLGSPILHRALCRNKSSPQQPQKSARLHPDDSPAGDSGISGGSASLSSFISGNGCPRALSQSFSSVSSSSAISPEWSPDLQAPSILNASKPNASQHSATSSSMGVRNCLAPPTLPYIPPPASPPPPVDDDYPGLEYPPIFEPGTYSLSDASLLRNRNKNSHHHHHHHPRHNHQGNDGNRDDHCDQ